MGAAESSANGEENSSSENGRVVVLYGTNAGTAKEFAKEIETLVLSYNKLDVVCKTMNEFEPEDLSDEKYVVFVASTYIDGAPTPDATFMYKWLEEASTDVRVPQTYLSGMKFTVFGLGSTLYEDHYNTVGVNLVRWIKSIGGTLFCPPGKSDSSISRDSDGTADTDFKEWREERFTPRLMNLLGVKRPVKTDLELMLDAADDEDADAEEQEGEEGEVKTTAAAADKAEANAAKLVDLEDMGSFLDKSVADRKAKSIILGSDDEDEAEAANLDRKLKPMITKKVGENLTKQGYKLIGSHSGVKLCRWTKAMLRGRGGCYKHTFYGIQSFQCMEMTPSLACANKCTFCWRAHTNPVGKKWTWDKDPPQMLVDQAIAKHVKMIKTLKGVPGVLPERFAEAQRVKHCALSLVGEPIMYPEINELIRLYHKEEISTFMVTNAQFPEKIETLHPVTQLYVSVDASTQESLKRIDRPLFKDFWPRFTNSLTALKAKKIRTVYRLTLVKGFNMSDLGDYAKLVAMGWPCFIEIKGVTFCGTANDKDISMKSVPFHQEVRDFAQSLCDAIGTDGKSSYEISCEHSHSLCILVSDTRFKIDGDWYTHIDYDKFHQLSRDWYENKTPFGAVDYMAKTPDYAIYGSPHEGFDPEETRFRKKRKGGIRTAKQVYQERLAEAKAKEEAAATTATAAAAVGDETAEPVVTPAVEPTVTPAVESTVPTTTTTTTTTE